MIEPDSPTWKTVQAWIAQEEQKHLDTLRSPGTEHDRSQYIRGKLAILDELKGLPAQNLTFTETVI